MNLGARFRANGGGKGQGTMMLQKTHVNMILANCADRMISCACFNDSDQLQQVSHTPLPSDKEINSVACSKWFGEKDNDE